MHTTIITGTGSYIPPIIKKNEGFLSNRFFTEDRQAIDRPQEEIVHKFQLITGISERRYASDDLTASGMATEAARLAIADSGTDPETIDQVIVAHNYGDVLPHTNQVDAVPSLASRVKQGLGIRNPACVPYDILFGCPGWLQGLIQADIFCRAGAAKKCLVIGTETLSRVIDPSDRDSMIFSDGAGACILELSDAGPHRGILSTSTRSDSVDEADYIHFGPSYAPGSDEHLRFIKMKGRKVYEYAVKHVPAAMKDCLDKSGADIRELKKVFIHQANEKMDESIIRAFYALYGMQAPDQIMPMCIQWLGNSSVATVPTLFDLVRKEQMPGHALQAGDLILFASVGAGMNINAVLYRY